MGEEDRASAQLKTVCDDCQMNDSPHFVELPRTILEDEDGSEEREHKKPQVPTIVISDVRFSFPGRVGKSRVLPIK